MTQVKMFASLTAQSLEQDVNRWLERNRVETYGIAFDSEASGHCTVYRALVLYNKA